MTGRGHEVRDLTGAFKIRDDTWRWMYYGEGVDKYTEEGVCVDG